MALDIPLEIYKFEPLYGKDINGKIKTWNLTVEKYVNYSVIVTIYGYNRLIETRRNINSGKNLNKSNMTNPYTQALAEAKSKWTKKRDIEQFYTEEPNVSLIEKQIVLPMLAHDYNKHKNKVVYPCYVQCKLDGFRMIYNTTTRQITTRQGKEYSIVKESGKLYEELGKLPSGLILDGELFTDKVNFEVLGVLRKTKELTKEEKCNLKKIEYHIYDIIDKELTFENRNNKIKELLSVSDDKKNMYEKLIYVNTHVVNNEAEIKEYHMRFLEQNFEGTMIRNKNSLYKTKQRSSDLLKYKDFEDAEFEIIDFAFEKDTSKADENLIIWIIKIPILGDDNRTDNSIKCRVRPQGTREERKELYKKCEKNFSQFKGRKLWTKYFSRTADGSLRFPSTYRSTYSEYIRDHII